MTIEKGVSWGATRAGRRVARRVDNDAEAAVALWEQRRAGVSEPTVGLCGGGIWSSLGGPSVIGRIETDEAVWFPVDVGVVTCEVAGEETTWPFLGSAVVRRRTWRSGTAFMNGPSLGPYRLGHRGHPNDGRLDVVAWTLRWSDLAKVARRARLGAHTPHPGIREQRATESTLMVDRGDKLWLDDRRVPIAPGTRITVTVLPDAGVVVV